VEVGKQCGTLQRHWPVAFQTSVFSQINQQIILKCDGLQVKTPINKYNKTIVAGKLPFQFI